MCVRHETPHAFQPVSTVYVLDIILKSVAWKNFRLVVHKAFKSTNEKTAPFNLNANHHPTLKNDTNLVLWRIQENKNGITEGLQKIQIKYQINDGAKLAIGEGLIFIYSA